MIDTEYHRQIQDQYRSILDSKLQHDMNHGIIKHPIVSRKSGGKITESVDDMLHKFKPAKKQSNDEMMMKKPPQQDPPAVRYKKQATVPQGGALEMIEKMEVVKPLPKKKKPLRKLFVDGAIHAKEEDIGGSKFEDMKNQMSNKDKAKEFWEKNEAIKKQLNNKANFDNRKYIGDKKEEKRILKIKGERYINRLIEKGYDPKSGIDAGEWMHNYYQKTGLFLKPNKDGYNYDWVQSKLPKTFSELIPSWLRKTLRYTGAEGIVDGMSNIVSAGEKFYKKPSLNSAIAIGKSTADVVKQGVNAYTNPQSVIKGVAQTAVKDAFGGSKGKGNAIQRRAVVVKKIMKEKGLSLIEASKYVKANNITY